MSGAHLEGADLAAPGVFPNLRLMRTTGTAQPGGTLAKGAAAAPLARPHFVSRRLHLFCDVLAALVFRQCPACSREFP